MRPEETLAAKLAATWYRGTVTCRDIHGAPPQTVDFDIDLGSGELVALEVTTHVDPEERAMQAAATKHPVCAVGLTKSWLVICLTSTEQRGFGLRIGPLLRKLEAREQEAFWAISLTPEDDAQDPPDVEVLLAREGVLSARSYLASPGGAQIFRAWTPSTSDVAAFVAQAVPPRGTKSDPPPVPNAGGPDERKWTAVLAAVEQEAKANATKLGNSGRERRELWIWCDTLPTRIALQSLPPPLGRPSLPAEVSAIWVAVGTDRGVYSWRYASDEGWTITPESGQPPLIGPRTVGGRPVV